MRTLRTVFAALLAGAAACGGGTTQPPPPPPPPPPPAAVRLDLAPGEVRVLTSADEFRRFEIAGASEGRQYEVIAMSGSRVEGGVTPIRFSTSATGAGASVVPHDARARVLSDPPPSASVRAVRTERERLLARPLHLGLQRRMRDELGRLGARVSPRAVGGGGVSSAMRASSLASADVPTVGETVEITSGVVAGQGTLSCATPAQVEGVVKTVGQNFVIVEDVAVAGHLTDQDYQDLDAELDEFVAPVDQQYFGAPGDLDGNERVIAFVTKEVNRITGPGANSVVIGFTTLADFADPADCPASNEGEIVWLVAPDPSGEFGPQLSVELVKSFARSLVAHEYQHLLNASQRVVVGSGTFDDVEDLWLNEGMSHVAEEVNGLYRVGVPTRAGLGFDDVGVGMVERLAFEDFHQGNFLNVASYMSVPNDVEIKALEYPPDPFPMRGFAYNFLRWIGDRYGASSPESLVGGSGEDGIFRELSSGGPSQLFGPDNVLRAINVVSGETPTWDEVLEEYFAAATAVDAEASVPADITFSTWDYPRLWEEMAASSIPGLGAGYPLLRSSIAMGPGVSSTVNFDLRSSAARYFRFVAGASHPDMLVEFSSTSGSNVPNGARARVVVVRTR